MLLYEIYTKDSTILTEETLDTIFKPKMCSENSKVIVNRLFANNYSIAQHTAVVSETDRTIVGLLWHENVVDRIFQPHNMYNRAGGEFYETILKNICFADYIDRITFQKQIWIFNEMSSLIKTFYNNELYNDYKKRSDNKPASSYCDENGGGSIRFTKVLTKYSTEYNNILFIQHMCNEMLMDKKDLIEFFNQIKCNNDEDAITTCCEQHDVTRLDVDRMFRYIDKCFSGHPLNFAVKGSEKYGMGLDLDMDNMPVDGDVDDFIDLDADDDISIDIDTDTNLGTSKCKNKSTTKNKSKPKPNTKSKSNKVNVNYNL
jgi:hypothetical protein